MGTMFDHFLASLKNRTNNLSDTVKAKTRRISNNLNAFKSSFSHKTKTTYYTIAQKQEETDYFENDFLSPRAYHMTTFSMDYNSVNENMEWFPYVPSSYDEHNVIDRFIRVITINDDSGFDVRRFSWATSSAVKPQLFCFRDEQIGKRSDEDWPWGMKMTTTRIGPEESQAYRPDCKVVSTWMLTTPADLV